MSYDTSIVYITARQLCSQAPKADGLRYHAPSRWSWERTRCGIVHEDRGQPVTSGMRRDTADLIADPCRICFGPAT